MLPNLTIETLKQAALEFCELESTFQNIDLYGVTDGKAVGTFIEHKFQKYLDSQYIYQLTVKRVTKYGHRVVSMIIRAN